MKDVLDYAALRAHCLAKPGSEETWPFGPDVTVFKVAEKMFALCRPEQRPLRVNLKCEPQLALLLREEYRAVSPGWHMNKRHWNTVELGADLPAAQVLGLVDQSYDLIVDALPKRLQLALRGG
ncbi:MAG: MmcQ/YjbR family DNA-binding protein [Candidatus Sericytochromatia bacterium]